MSNYKRLYIEGGIYFFTVVTFKRRPFLTTELARKCLHQSWQEVRDNRPFEIDAVCLMPDHLHCVWTLPEGDSNFSVRWNSIKSKFTKLYLANGGEDGQRNRSRKRSGEAAVWHRRFWEHALRDPDDYRRHVDYIHFNPVKHGLTQRPGDWDWSSFRRYVEEGIYEDNWGSIEPKHLVGMRCVGE